MLPQKKILTLALLFLSWIMILTPSHAHAQGPRGKDFGFGIILLEPTGGTIKYWLNQENALVADIGYSYFGAPRIDVDYLWHFQAFNSNVAKLYAGFGGVVGFGRGYYGVYYKHGQYIYTDDAPFYYRSYYNTDVGFAIRAIFGLNVIPRKTPLELFFELGPLIGISPAFGVAVDVALGVRFYP
jgi:hypothetical protein